MVRETAQSGLDFILLSLHKKLKKYWHQTKPNQTHSINPTIQPSRPSIHQNHQPADHSTNPRINQALSRDFEKVDTRTQETERGRHQTERRRAADLETYIEQNKHTHVREPIKNLTQHSTLRLGPMTTNRPADSNGR
jgi:hypothetical protein